MFLKFSFFLLLIVLFTQCTPFDDDKQKKECVINGKSYNSGEAIPCDDSCNSCWCEDGQMGTRLMGCYEDQRNQSLK